MKNYLRYLIVALACTLILSACSIHYQGADSIVTENGYRLKSYEGTDVLGAINHHSWLAGAEDCASSTAPALDVLQVNQDSYILRQSPCLSGEAPFMYLLIGQDKALLLDSGDSTLLPLSATLDALIGDLPLLVLHSHSHGDHRRGDELLATRANTIVMGTDLATIKHTLHLPNWPLNTAQIDLGDRAVDIIPSPGHHATAISLYDPKTRWLLSGDSIYPGRLIVHNWNAYKASIERLTHFSQQHPISAILGAHIEMTSELQADYVASQYRPNEAPLALQQEDLRRLHSTVQSLGDKPAITTSNKVSIHPLTWAPRLLVSVLNALFG
jgi:glyoxylase-like metal-dependent hydrolase (beta-lactamase superfamily II)